MRPSKTIFITFQQEGLHLYPEAGNSPELSDVFFLSYEHRHIFHVKVWIEVVHTNRELEFIQVKRDLQQQTRDGGIQFNNKSCEMISDDIASYLQTKYNNRWIAIEVSEDGENGSYCEYPVRNES